MNSDNEYRSELRIGNPLGFHVRPVQRFAELAQAFKSEITVEIDDRQASGKSVMGLMSLGGRYGARMSIKIKGEDARQAMDIIRYMVEEDFFVEDDIQPGSRPRRHIERLRNFASCFESDIRILLDGREIDPTSEEAAESLDFPPTEDMDFKVEGSDAPQASKVLQKLLDYRFYVEDVMNATSG